jgi:hypothetical protein
MVENPVDALDVQVGDPAGIELGHCGLEEFLEDRMGR